MDRWAYLEKVYNSLSLPSPDCSPSYRESCPRGPEKLRSDFEFFLRNAGLNFLEWAKLYLNLSLKNNWRGLSNDELREELKVLLDDAYDKAKKLVLPKTGPTVVGTAVESNETTEEEVEKMAAEVFAR